MNSLIVIKVCFLILTNKYVPWCCRSEHCVSGSPFLMSCLLVLLQKQTQKKLIRRADSALGAALSSPEQSLSPCTCWCLDRGACSTRGDPLCHWQLNYTTPPYREGNWLRSSQSLFMLSVCTFHPFIDLFCPSLGFLCSYWVFLDWCYLVFVLSFLLVVLLRAVVSRQNNFPLGLIKLNQIYLHE